MTFTFKFNERVAIKAEQYITRGLVPMIQQRHCFFCCCGGKDEMVDQSDIYIPTEDDIRKSEYTRARLRLINERPTSEIEKIAPTYKALEHLCNDKTKNLSPAFVTLLSSVMQEIYNMVEKAATTNSSMQAQAIKVLKCLNENEQRYVPSYQAQLN